jgi:biopolymer transport protein ExbD
MAFGSFENGSANQPMAEINTTPLVDVMLVLLVIFIITAPLFQQAVPIDLPQVSASRLDDKATVIRLSIAASGAIHLDNEAVDETALLARFATATAGGKQPELHVRADRATRYDRVAEILAEAQKAGIVRIAFVTEPKR